METVKKIVLAYSGGLDTSVIIKWLIEKYGCEVIAVAADLGQQEDLSLLEGKALKSGASKIYIKDLKKEFIREYCYNALKAGAVYEDKYLLATALGRPLIASELVKIAHEEGADAVAHGSTGKGNDQVRFDVSVMALDPSLKIIAPLRRWEFKSRDEEIDYAAKHNIPVEATKEKPYSIDRNLWGISIECGILEDPWIEPPKDVYQITSAPEEAPDEPTYITVEFWEGIPVALDGEKLRGGEIIDRLNNEGGKHGVGRVDILENRLVGIKSREIYEAPAAAILHFAKRELDALVLDKETLHFKESLGLKYSEMVYNGLWFSPLRIALDAFFDEISQSVTGDVRLKLYKGTLSVVGRKSSKSLYDINMATYDARDQFNHRDGESFCKIWGLPLKIVGENRKKEEFR